MRTAMLVVLAVSLMGFALCGCSDDSGNEKAAEACTECEKGKGGENVWCADCKHGWFNGEEKSCEDCWKGLTGENVWCEGCSKGYTDGAAVACKDCWDPNTACTAHGGSEEDASKPEEGDAAEGDGK